MLNCPIQVRWSANQMASSVVSLSLGTLAALGRDNVQSIAYVVFDRLAPAPTAYCCPADGEAGSRRGPRARHTSVELSYS